MEESIIKGIEYLVTNYPKALLVYGALTALYPLACFIATFTKTDKDDKILDKIKVFFSIPVKKKDGK